jgi:hypothetical protein
VLRTDGVIYQSIPDMPCPTFWSIFGPASAIPEGEDADVMPLGMVKGTTSSGRQKLQIVKSA